MKCENSGCCWELITKKDVLGVKSYNMAVLSTFSEALPKKCMHIDAHMTMPMSSDILAHRPVLIMCVYVVHPYIHVFSDVNTSPASMQ